MKCYLYIALVALTLTACRSSKSAVKAPDTNTSASTKTTHITNNTAALASVKKVAAMHLSQQGVTASTKVRLSGVGGKDLSVNGKLQMKRNDVIRLSLRFLGMEVGLMEFTPNDVLVVDRMNKQFVRAKYGEVSFLRQAGLDFYALQSLFWNELFIPGQHTLSAEGLGCFELVQKAGLNVLTPKNTPKLAYHFYADPQANTIQRLQVRSNNAAEKGEFAFNYDGFEQFGGRPFPTQMRMAVTGTGKKDITLALSLSSLKADASFDTRTTVSAKYTQRSVQQVLGQLGM